jgi:hypothetical protein
MSDEKLMDFTYQIEQASWDLLKPHHARESLFVLTEKLMMIEVANAMEKDNVTKIKAWLESGDLYRPTVEEVAKWEQDSSKEFARFCIVQPYVLMQVMPQLLQ